MTEPVSVQETLDALAAVNRGETEDPGDSSQQADGEPAEVRAAGGIALPKPGAGDGE